MRVSPAFGVPPWGFPEQGLMVFRGLYCRLFYIGVSLLVETTESVSDRLGVRWMPEVHLEKLQFNWG